jgi:hypothetical protein
MFLVRVRMFLIRSNLKGELWEINCEGVSPLPELYPHGGHPVAWRAGRASPAGTEVKRVTYPSGS